MKVLKQMNFKWKFASKEKIKMRTINKDRSSI